MTRRFKRRSLGALLVVSVLAAGAAASEVRSESKHFVIVYDSDTSFDYVALVQSGLEAAYDVFVLDWGFPTFPDAVEVSIVDDGTGALGSEYLGMHEDGAPRPVIEIAPEASMWPVGGALSDPSLSEAVRSTTAHEFFHVLQDYASWSGPGDVSEAAFVEPLATAVQEVAAPDADDYVAAADDFLLAPDAMSFFDRHYDGGLFWVFVLDRYGGLDAIRRVMKASADNDGSRAVDRAFAAEGLTFLDLWAKFTVALATGTLPDAKAVEAMRASWEAEFGSSGVDVEFPPAVAIADWTGSPAVLDHVTELALADLLLGYSDRDLLAPLRVTYPYGIDAVVIRPRSAAPVHIVVDAPQPGDFRIAFVGRRGDSWDLLSFSGHELVVRDPSRYDEIRVILTRGEVGDGVYTVRLSAP